MAMASPKPQFWSRLRDPVNGLTHLTAFILSLVGTGVLLWLVRDHPGRMLTAALYGLSMCGCFLASSCHHLIRGSRKAEMRLLKLDHAAIYPFIAGTYTPICAHLLHGLSSWILLAVVWALAIAGIVYKLAIAPDPTHVDDPPGAVSTGFYVLMGWLVVWKVPELVSVSHPGSLPLAVIGGLAYSLGGIILTRRLLDLWPGRFGHHEIWHLCVITGAACLYAFVVMNLA